jgi:hypothetical protein
VLYSLKEAKKQQQRDRHKKNGFKHQRQSYQHASQEQPIIPWQCFSHIFTFIWPSIGFQTGRFGRLGVVLHADLIPYQTKHHQSQ